MDPFVVLGVHRHATKEEIKAAFRKKAMQYHPDRHASAPDSIKRSAAATFQALNDAYQLLMDDSQRHAHARGTGGHRRHGAAPHGYAGSWGTSSSAHAGSSSRSGYSSSGGAGAGYQQYARRQRGGFGGLDFVGAWRTFSAGFTRAEAKLTLVLAGLVVAGAALLEPVAVTAWEARNEGKLFKDIERDTLQEQRAELEALRRARRLREEEAAASRASQSSVAVVPSLSTEQQAALVQEQNAGAAQPAAAEQSSVEQQTPQQAGTAQSMAVPQLAPGQPLAQAGSAVVSQLDELPSTA